MVNVLAGFGSSATQAGLFGAIQPLLNTVGQAAYKGLPNQIPTPDLLVTQRMRGEISFKSYFNMMAQLGFNQERSGHIFAVGHQLLNSIELITLHRRGEIELQSYSDRMRQLGWHSAQAVEMLKITEPVPSVQDVIMFAVREVYDPEIAASFGQFENGDETYEKARPDLEALGMTKERFMKFWAAHWQLPSVQQGFQMLHRDAIDTKMFDQLMIAADIMPAWREPLKAISFRPYTRVDVRRMHKTGVLTDDDLLRAYLDLGYDDEKAQTMADFTIEYNADPADIDQTRLDKAKQKIKDITLEDILKGYHFKLMDAATAKAMIVDIGFLPEEAAFHVSAADFDAENDELETHLKIMHDGYIRGAYSREDVTTQTAQLQLPGAYTSFLLKLWDIERSAKTRQPSKAELLGWMRRGQITEQVVRDELSKMGYSDQWVTLYIASNYESVQEDDITRDREITKSEALRAFKNGFIEWPEVVDSLKDLGFTDASILFYKSTIDQELEAIRAAKEAKLLTPEEIRLKVVAKTDILKSYVDGIIKWDEAENRLIMAHFTSDAIDFYRLISDNKIQKAKEAAELKELTPEAVRSKVAAKTDILKAYVDFHIDWNEAERRLKLANFTDDTIAFYRLVSDLKIEKKRSK